MSQSDLNTVTLKVKKARKVVWLLPTRTRGRQPSAIIGMSSRLPWVVKKRPMIWSQTFGISTMLAPVTASWQMGSYSHWSISINSVELSFLKFWVLERHVSNGLGTVIPRALTISISMVFRYVSMTMLPSNSSYCNSWYFPFMQITDTMLQMLAKFMATLIVELGYPCSHRRMKKYITEDGIDNFTR